MLNRAVWVEEAINTSSNVCSISRHSVRQSAELHVRDQPCLQHTSPSSSSSSPSPSPSAAAFTTLKSSTFYHQNNITYSTQHKKCTKHHNSERWYSQQFVKQRYLNNVNLTRHASHHHHFSSNFTASCTFMSSDRTVTHHLILGHLISFCYILVPDWDARATRTGYWPSYLAVTCISVNRVSSSDGRLYDWTESTLLIFMNMQRTRSPSTLNWLEPTRPTDSDTSPAPTRLTGDPVSW